MQEILNHFKNLSQIPHCSFDTIKMKDFLEDYAKKLDFQVNIDKAGNIHCVKGKPKICLQAHYDMVCMGEAPKIELFEENGFLKAKNSSLGADNGMGVAMIMQAMKEFKNLECLITNDEEVGLLGANNLEHRLNSKNLLNLDHEGENDVIIGCAGGVDIKATLSYEREEKIGEIFELEAINFKGGHSGIDIVHNIKNAIKEMAYFILENNGEIIEFNGGERHNSIAKYSKAVVLFENTPKNNPYINFKSLGKQKVQVCKQGKTLLNLINSFTQGVRAYDEHLNMVRSSINLSLLKMNEKDFSIELLARSNVLEDLQKMEFETKILFESFNCKTQSSNFYPPWEGKENEFSAEVFKALSKNNDKARILAVHAGLECGIIEKKQELFCASIGPNIYNPHSTDEKCEIKSVEKIYKVVKDIIEKYQ